MLEKMTTATAVRSPVVLFAPVHLAAHSLA